MNNNSVGIKGLARILEDLSIQRIKENETIGSIAQIEGLQAALDGKAASVHTHNYYGECNTASDTAAKEVNLVIGENNVPFVLKKGSVVAVKFSFDNTAENPTLNVDGTGAIPIDFGIRPISATRLSGGNIYNFLYNGSAWVAITAADANYSITASYADRVNSSLVIKLNGGEVEGVNRFTFDGSWAHTVDITASGIGAAASVHTHAINDITGLQAALDGKAEEEHTHVMSDITDLSATIESLKNLYAEETVTNEMMEITEEEANSDENPIGTHNGGKDLRCFLKLNESTSGHTYYKRIAPASNVGKRVEIITYNRTGDNLLKVVLLPTNESFILPGPGNGTGDFTTVQSLEITAGVYVILIRTQVDSGSAWLVNRFPMI